MVRSEADRYEAEMARKADKRLAGSRPDGSPGPTDSVHRSFRVTRIAHQGRVRTTYNEYYVDPNSRSPQRRRRRPHCS